MSRTINRITDITGTNQGGTAVATLETGRRYLGLLFFIRVNNVLTSVADVVDRIRLKVNERTIWDVSAARYLATQAAETTILGNAAGTGVLPINFARIHAADKTDELFTAWDLFGERTFTVELTLKDLANPADVIRINGMQSYDFGFWPGGPGGSRSKNIIHLQEVSENLVNGAVDITKLPIAKPIQRVFFSTAATISLVEVDADGRRVHEAETAENAELLKLYGISQTPFAYIWAPDHSEQVLDHLAVSRTLNVRVHAGSAQPVTCLVESMGSGF